MEKEKTIEELILENNISCMENMVEPRIREACKFLKYTEEQTEAAVTKLCPILKPMGKRAAELLHEHAWKKDNGT